MDKLSEKTIIITGAASGIGKELAIQLGKLGAKLLLIDFDEPNLLATVEEVKQKGGDVLNHHLLDVSDRAGVESLSQEILSKYEIDVLINNAGVSLGEVSLEKVTYDEMEWIFGINLWGVIYMTKSFLPHLRTRPSANIINLSSIFGITGFGGHGTYSTTKFAVRGFSENLRQELVNTNVRVMAVHPGGIKTNIVRNSKGGNQTNKEFEAKKFDKMAKTTAEEAARKIIKALQKDKPRLLIGRDAVIIDKFVRFFPGTYEGKIFKDLKVRMKRLMGK